MADFYASLGANAQLHLQVTESSYSVPGNTSVVHANVWLERVAGTGRYSNNTNNNWSDNIDGQGASGSGTYDLRGGGSQLLLSTDFTITHSSDGSKTIAVSAYFNDPAANIGTGTASGSLALTTIPRATQPTVSPTSGNTGSTYAIDVSTVASGAFYHDFYYSLDGGSTYTSIAANVAATTTSQNWTPAHTLLPNSTSVTAIIRVDTRSSSGGTIIGTKTVSLPLTVPSTVKPSVSAVSFVDAQVSSPDMPTLMGAAGRFVQGWSKLKPTVTAVGSGGSTITASSVTQNGQTAASGAAFGLPITLSGAVPYTAIATDSRGRASDPFNSTVTVTAYNFPSLPVPTMQRTSDAAGAIPSPTGTYIAITPLASVSSLNFSGEKNLLEWQVRTRPVGGSWTTVQAWTNVTVSGNTWTTKKVISGYSSTTAYEVEVSIRDLFGKNGYSTASTVVVQTVTVPTESVAFDWDHGEGLGINKYRTAGVALDVHGTIVGDADITGLTLHQGVNPVVDFSNSASTSTPGIVQLAADSDVTSAVKAVTPHGLLAQLILQAQAKLNLITNGALRTNQDGYVSAASIPIGTYAFDGFKSSGVTNLLTNPSAEGTLPAILNQGITLTKDSSWSQSRTNSFKMVGTGTADSFMSFGENATLASLGLVAGKTYTISGYCKVITAVSGTAAPAARARSVTVIWNAGASEQSSSGFVNTVGTITRVSMTFTVPNNTTNGYIRFYLGGTAGTVQWDALMLTEGSILYPYFDGATSDCSWSGTADASTSYSVPNVVPTLTGTFDSNFGSLFTLNTNARVSQIVERSRVPAATYTIAQGGTATMRVYNNTTAPGSRPAFAAGPITFVADGTDDVVVEFSGGGSGATIGQVRMFTGSNDYGWALPSLGDELRDCERYFWSVTNPSSATTNIQIANSAAYSVSAHYGTIRFPVDMRAAPYCSATSVAALLVQYQGVNTTSTAILYDTLGTTSCRIVATVGGSVTAGYSSWMELKPGFSLRFDARIK